MEELTETERLRRAVRECLDAMRKAVDEGCVDHLDASERAGEWWHAALEAGDAALRGDQ